MFSPASHRLYRTCPYEQGPEQALAAVYPAARAADFTHGPERGLRGGETRGSYEVGKWAR